MFSPKDEIKNKLDIVEVIGQYVKLQKAGSSYKGLCPFHNDKNPSFYVSPSRQIWHCFGCGAGGDIFTFIMKIENVDFSTALRMLAEKAGVKLKPQNPRLYSQKQKLVRVNQTAAQFFERNLWQNKEVLNYLKRRGLNEETIREFHLGWAEDEWRSLSNFLVKKGFRPQDIVESGLAISKKEPAEISSRGGKASYQITLSDIYDRFRGRIMFPIEDIAGNVCGFSGRIFAEGKQLKTVRDINTVGKYVNTPQTLIFDKSQLLFGLSHSKKYLRSQKSTVIVEGQMDFLAAWQAGVKNIVATSGVALTPFHFNILKRYNHTLILGFDMDEAGRKAIERTIDLALEQEMEVKILCLPQGKDIADYLLQPENQAKIGGLVQKAEPIMDFYFQRAKEQGDKSTLEGKKKIASYFLPQIKKLKNAIDRSFWIEKLARYLELPPQALEDELNKINLGFRKRKEKKENKNRNSDIDSLQTFPLSRLDAIADRILAFLIKFPSWRKLIPASKSYFPPSRQKILQVIESASQDSLGREEMQKMSLDEEVQNKINQLALQADYETEALKQSQISPEEELKNQLKMLKEEAIKKNLDAISAEIREAEKNDEKEKVRELMKKFSQLSKHLIN